MCIRKGIFLVTVLACIMLFQVSSTEAHNPGYVVPSPGVPGAVITLNGTEGGGEWAGSTMFDILDYGVGNPLSATVKALHKADGIYLLIMITDDNYSDNDAVQIRFDLNHNGGAMPEATDWGIEVRRDNTLQPIWGPANAIPATWGNIPAGNVGVNSGPGSWTVEVRLPTTPTGTFPGFSLTVGTVGIHFMLYDIDQENGVNSAIYTQWPQPPAMTPDALLDQTPNDWGDYVFDPATTFPNLAVTGVRRGDVGPEDYYKISHTANNRFEVRVNNPGGTAVADASNVRINLYLAARGIGEPWHRLDTDAVLDGDCSAPTWASSLIPKLQVCNGNVSLDDITTQSLADVVNNIAQYTIKDGTTRNGGQSITITGGTNNWLDILNWNTTAAQDGYFTQVMVNGNTYNRQHSCMKAEAIFANDPNPSDNVRQVNMDFVCVLGAMAKRFDFTLSWAGFGKYNPDIGKEMFLQVDLRNMDAQDGWKYQMEGAERLRENVFVAKLQGKKSLPLQVNITAPPADVLGNTLKENLMIPPKAGGDHANVEKKSGISPIYVKVASSSTVLVANYSFDENDIQFVDLDGERKTLPPNGPAGLPSSYLQKVGKKENLLVPDVPLGALIGSFDNFRTAFEIGEGVQVKVPEGATHLALGINDLIGAYNDNSGTGFRVKVTQRPEKSSLMKVTAQGPDKLQLVPISEVMPILCVNGYENIGQKRTLGGTPHELYRYIGNVCWGVINVFPRDRSERPDQGDPFPTEPGPTPGICACGQAMGASLGFSTLMMVFGIALLWRHVQRKSNVRRSTSGSED